MAKYTDPVLFMIYGIIFTLKMVGYITYSWWIIAVVPFLFAWGVNEAIRKLIKGYIDRKFRIFEKGEL